MLLPRFRRLPVRQVLLLPVLALLLAPAPSLRAAKETFEYTGAQQNFVVPTGATTVTVQAFGAQGGGHALSSPGYYVGITRNLPQGGITTATILSTAGETLAIFVGGKGADGVNGVGAAGGFNGGGAAHGDTPNSGGGGGGASDVRQGGAALANRVVVAGGGGGEGGNPTSFSNLGNFVGDGGGLIGRQGFEGSSAEVSGGTGGTQTAGGSVGTGSATTNNYATAGALGQGGIGDGSYSSIESGGGGGGGGYYGGGGGAMSPLSISGNSGSGGGAAGPPTPSPRRPT
jgi:hypothetical protein